jgi:sensor domain CHASE-containing protein
MRKRLILFSLLLTSVFFIIGCSNTETSNTATTEEQTAAPNTSARVDQIMLQAKDDAENFSEDEATETWEAGFDYLKAHMENFYESNEVMEQSMYYGTFIYEYVESNATDMNNLTDSSQAAYDAGTNTVEAIKYVYRDAEKIEDASTQGKLQEAKENLAKFQ